MQVDLDAAVKTFEASVEAQVRRFIIISALHADNREFFSKLGLRNYYIAKHYADRILVDEFSDKLDYTILKPTSLSDDAATGKSESSRAQTRRLVLSPEQTWPKSFMRLLMTKTLLARATTLLMGI